MSHFQYREGQLHAESVPLDRIAEAVGTPTYVYSRAALEANWRAFDQGLASHDATIRYSVKSNSNLAVLALFAQLGSGFDIVSGGELERVIRAGGRPDQTVFSGVAKSRDEIAQALESGIFSINLESHAELVRIHEVARSLDLKAPISVRVNPDVDAKTHPYISTGLQDNKFGVNAEQMHAIFEYASQQPHLDIVGIAVHIGSQMTSLDPIVEAIDRVVDLTEQLAKNGISIRHLDLGGGLGVRYRDEQPPTIDDYCKAVLDVLQRRSCQAAISIEPGRSVTANTGVFLSRVEYLKSNAQKHFALVDGAMNDLIRPALYDAWMDIVPVRQSNSPTKLFDVVGPVCESADFLGKQRPLAIDSGDLLAVHGAGAYGAVMASNYNSRPKPAEVLVDGDQFDIIRSRETIDEMLGTEAIPARFLT